MEAENPNNGQIELAVVRGETSGVFGFTDTALVLSDDMSFIQWQEVLRTIKWIKRKAAIGLADCIVFGIKKWGADKVDQALEQLEFEATIVKAAVAIKSIPSELRFENLDPDHYVELAKAGLPKAKAIRWARIASEQHLTATQLRFSIVENEVVDKASAKALQHGVITVQGIRQHFDIWLHRVGGLNGIMKMDEDHQQEIMGELDQIIDFGISLRETIAATK